MAESLKGRRLHVPDGMRKVRYQAPQMVDLPNGEIPMIDPKDPDHRQLQERFIPHIRVFDLSKSEELEEYEQVWAQLATGDAKMSEHQVQWDDQRGRYVAYMRWATTQIQLPAAALGRQQPSGT